MNNKHILLAIVGTCGAWWLVAKAGLGGAKIKVSNVNLATGEFDVTVLGNTHRINGNTWPVGQGIAMPASSEMLSLDVKPEKDSMGRLKSVFLDLHYIKTGNVRVQTDVAFVNFQVQ